MKEYYVYVHYRESDHLPFYVGKGKDNRAASAGGRNIYWKKIAKKHGWIYKKIREGLSEQCAHSLEKILISANRSSLCNVTDGGEGVSGLRHTAATKKKMSENRKPGWVPFWSGKTMPDSLKEKLRSAKLGRRQSPEHAAKSRIAKLGKPQPQSARDATRLLKSVAIISGDGEIFPSAAQAARVLSVRLGLNASQGNISMCTTGRRKTAYGTTWKYA